MKQQTRRRTTTFSIALIFVLVLVLASWALYSWNQQSAYEAAYQRGRQQLDQRHYKQAYTTLRSIKGEGTRRDSYNFYRDIAVAAYQSGDKTAGEQYAKDGLKALPAFDSAAYDRVPGTTIGVLSDIHDGIYVDPPRQQPPPPKDQRPPGYGEIR